MRPRGAMAYGVAGSARTAAALLLLSLLAVLSPRDPAQAESGDGTLEIAVTGTALSLAARSVPLDRVLRRLGEIYGFSALVRCGAAACPRVQARLTGKLDEVLAWLLHAHHYSRLYGPGAAAGSHGTLRRLVVLTSKPGQAGPYENPQFSIARQGAALSALAHWGSRGTRGPGAVGTAPGNRIARPIQPPLPSYRVTSGFGPRLDPLDGRSTWHQGVDLAGPARSRVLSTAAGTVVSAGWHGNYGTMVTLDHGAGVTTRYAHLSEALVEPGQELARGAPLGVIGQSGRSTGDHLHFEVRIDERPVDPMAFLEAGPGSDPGSDPGTGPVAARLDRPDRAFPIGATVVNGF